LCEHRASVPAGPAELGARWVGNGPANPWCGEELGVEEGVLGWAGVGEMEQEGNCILAPQSAAS